MAEQKEKIISKDLLIARIAESISDETKLIRKIMGEIKNARRKPRVRLNLNEKQLRVHLAEVIKKWERVQISLLINKFLKEMETSWQKGENVVLRGIFSTRVYRTPARKVKNPQTGQPILIPAKNRLKFQVSSRLKREINSR